MPLETFPLSYDVVTRDGRAIEDAFDWYASDALEVLKGVVKLLHLGGSLEVENLHPGLLLKLQPLVFFLLIQT